MQQDQGSSALMPRGGIALPRMAETRAIELATTKACLPPGEKTSHRHCSWSRAASFSDGQNTQRESFLKRKMARPLKSSARVAGLHLARACVLIFVLSGMPRTGQGQLT